MQIERLPGSAFRLVHGGVIRRARVLSPRAAELLSLMPEKAARRHLPPVAVADAGPFAAIVVNHGQEVKAGEPLALSRR